jgi:Tfp pilus assembly protein PilP
MSFAKTLALAILLATAVSGLRAQDKPAAKGDNGKAVPPTSATKPQPKPAGAPSVPRPQAQPKQPAAQAKDGSAKPPASTAKPQGQPEKSTASAAGAAAKPAATQSKQSPAKPGAKPAERKPAEKPASAAGVKSAPGGGAKAGVARSQKTPTAKVKKPDETATASADVNLKVPRRDPFESLIGREQASAAASRNLPPGKAGLQVSTLRLDGVVRAPNGMIAVVSNPQMRTYFLREGDQLYDGRVEKIGMDGVSFHEIGKDAFGKPVERQVNKRIYASAGEQQ